MGNALPKDRHGRTVAVGSRVRVVAISQSLIDVLPEGEKEDVKSMVGDVLEVYEIDSHGAPWVEKGWPSESGKTYRSHSVALDSSEMELVDEGTV